MSKENTRIVDKAFAAIEKKDFDVPELEKFKLNENKYPRNIIDDLRRMDSDKKKAFKSCLDKKTSKDTLDFRIDDLKTPLTQILYLMVWKQGDLDKFDRIIEGLKSSPKLEEAYENVSKAFVFFQLGRHIMFDEPIVDQHSIRAFTALVQEKKIIREALKNEKIQYQCIKDSLGSKLHKKLIVEYVQWVKSIELQCDKMYKIDNIMYSLGKYLKTEFKK